MPVEFITEANLEALPVYLIGESDALERWLSGASLAWAQANDFKGDAGRVLLLPDDHGVLSGALLGTGGKADGHLVAGALGKALPEGSWRLTAGSEQSKRSLIGIALGNYAFTRYGKKPGRALRIAVPEDMDIGHIRRVSEAVLLVRDLVNTPTNDMGPSALEQAARRLAGLHDATVRSTVGDELIAANFPMIHAVGRASPDAPRLIDIRWGSENAPKVTLVGKGVCFDTGGLDIKPSAGMLLMKKDMGGAANVLGLASMIMSAKLNLRLRVLIPAVENAIAGNAFRPGDVLRSRKGVTVEIGNTDAEGRLVLADALNLADEEHPELLLNMATLTGAARVALGPDLPPFFTDDDAFAADLASAALATEDPLWRLPLWAPYDARLGSRVADTNNVTTDGFAGSITAALFLKKFIEHAKTWVHFDIFAWNPVEKPHAPVGGEAQAIRALETLISRKYAA